MKLRRESVVFVTIDIVTITVLSTRWPSGACTAMVPLSMTASAGTVSSRTPAIEREQVRRTERIFVARIGSLRCNTLVAENVSSAPSWHSLLPRTTVTARFVPQVARQNGTENVLLAARRQKYTRRSVSVSTLGDREHQ